MVHADPVDDGAGRAPVVLTHESVQRGSGHVESASQRGDRPVPPGIPTDGFPQPLETVFVVADRWWARDEGLQLDP